MKAPTSTSLKVIALAAALVAAGLAPTVAEARPRGRVNVWVGGPLWWPGFWGYPMVVERPVYVQPPLEPVYVQPAPQNHLWYYCHDAQMYYPYVTSCPSPWQEVPATPAPAPAAAPEAPPAASPVPAAAPTRTTPAPVPPARPN
jgi:hypothetical protein